MIVRLLLPAVAFAASLPAARIAEVSTIRPDATVDLRTEEGARLVKAQWRYSDARVVEVDFRAPGPNRKPTGRPIRTLETQPRAGIAGFDDSNWEIISPLSLEERRSPGRLSFNWYRFKITVPQKVGNFDTAGSTAVFETVVDDYAEIWVDGKLPLVIGSAGGPFIRGWNAPNRVVLSRNARPGQTFQIAMFCANGPLSDPPMNYIWIRSATVDFYRPERQSAPAMVLRVDPKVDELIPPGTMIEKLAGGFRFTEGPVWVKDGGYLLFSDPNSNVIHRWSPNEEEVSTFRTKSGYSGPDIGEHGQPGSNGLAIDREGRLTVNEHGNRRVVRIEKNGVVTVLADNYQGKRLNSPNDLVYKSDGALYFTDPPFGLPRFFDDPRKELPFSGVFRWKDGKLDLLSTDLKGPNGIAFSPDEKYLYVTNWDEKKKVIMRYAVRPGGTLENGEIFFDMTSAPGEEALDGLKIDRSGNLYASGPGGVWIISAEGKHLGTVQAPELPANFAWGGEDGRTLYMTARTGLYGMRVGIGGLLP